MVRGAVGTLHTDFINSTRGICKNEQELRIPKLLFDVRTSQRGQGGPTKKINWNQRNSKFNTNER